MATVDCLIQFEATFNAQAAPTPTAPYDICPDCFVGAAHGTNPTGLLPNTSSSSNSVPKFQVLWMSAPFYRHICFLWRLSLLADFPGPLHGDIQRKKRPLKN